MAQIGVALHNYHAIFRSFPPVAVYDTQGQPLLSWRVLILPFLDGQKLYEQFHLDEPWDSPHNLPLAAQMPDQFRCPSDRSSKPNATNYLAISGEGTFFPPHGIVTTEDVKDGTAMTAMVGEIRSSTVVWTKPEDVVLDDNFVAPGPFSSAHVDRLHFLFGDGTNRFIRDTTDPKTIRALMTISGGEPVDMRDF